MIQFYAPDILTNPLLPADEGAHCVRVLRKNVGDHIFVTDGKGRRYECEITEINPKRSEVWVRVIDYKEIPNHWGCRITLGIAPTKNADRMEWFVEKAVEMGIDRIVLMKCRHSERKEMRTDRLMKIAVSAMKQSLKTTLPKIEGGVDFGSLVNDVRGVTPNLYIAHCCKESERKPLIKELMKHKAGEDIVLLIGPEGDFSNDEIGGALDAGFVAVTLGESRLRTETAAMFGVASIHNALQLL